MSERDFAYTVKRARELACSDASYAPSTSEVNGLNWANDEIGRLRVDVEALRLRVETAEKEAAEAYAKIERLERELSSYKNETWRRYT